MKLFYLISSGLVLALITTSDLNATNFTQDNVTKSQEIINQTIKTYGGAEKLSTLNSIIIDYDVRNINAGQSRKTEAPWDITKGDRLDAFDFINQIAVTRFYGSGGGNSFAGTNLINGENSANFNDILKTRTKVESPDFDVTAGPGLRVNSTLLLKRLQQYATSARHLGEIDFQGNKHDLLSFTMPGGPAITLYIDQKTHLINKSERVLGTLLVEYFFKDYKTVEGILFPHESSYTVNDLPSQTFTVEFYKLNQPLTEYTSSPVDYVDIAAAPPTDMKTNDMGNGVYWVTQNNQNSLFVEFKDHLMMIGGLPGVTQRIAEIAKTLPNKPVKYTVMTHHHSDHIGGSQEVHDAGIKFISVKEHEKVIREVLSEKDRKSAQFEFIKDKKVYKDKSQTLEIYDIGPTEHTEHLLLAYLPKQGIIFEADHYSVAASGPIPSRSPNIETLLESIQKRGLKVKTIASSHSTVAATFEQLLESYNKAP